jgi:hypothetical protein
MGRMANLLWTDFLLAKGSISCLVCRQTEQGGVTNKWLLWPAFARFQQNHAAAAGYTSRRAGA